MRPGALHRAELLDATQATGEFKAADPGGTAELGAATAVPMLVLVPVSVEDEETEEDGQDDFGASCFISRSQLCCSTSPPSFTCARRLAPSHLQTASNSATISLLHHGGFNLPHTDSVV